MSMSLSIDLRGFDKDVRKFSKDLKSLPKSKKSPLVRWLHKGYRNRLRKDAPKRPSVLQSGTWRGSRWAKLAESTVGNIGKRGRRKGNRSRYKASDKILGKLRPQGMIGDFLQSNILYGAKGLSARITSNRPYGIVHEKGSAKRNIPKRPWTWSKKVERVESKAFSREVARYIGAQMKRRFRG